MGIEKNELLQGTLDMLILKALALGPRHGYGVAERIQQTSGDLLTVEEGSLYPALHRLEKRGLIRSQWGLSENNRRAKFYELTPDGANRLESESANWARLAKAISRILRTV
ncbi:MAG TPA: PadR family transcriptional regulator [Bryobacteraceae bacterium]|jgi:PadR family transcriptional regulator|nr:PadR family transcriptional regulator [Bryobacteraceae bacterium]